MGDTLLFTPSIRYLKEHFPFIEVTVLVMTKLNYEVLYNNPYIDKLIYFDFLGKGPVKSLFFLLKLRGKYDFTMNPYPSNRAEYNLLSFIINAPVRLGVDYKFCKIKCLNFLNNLKIEENLKEHVVKQNIKLVMKTMFSTRYKEYPLTYVMTETEKKEAEEFRRNFKGKKLIGIWTGSSRLKKGINKRWNFENFLKLANLIKKSVKKSEIIGIFGPDEEDYAYVFQKNGFITITGEPIRKVASYMSRLDVFICNDGGLLNLASALKIPVVAIFGPTSHYFGGPWKTPHKIVRKNLPCSPCFYYSPKPLECKLKENRFKCLKEITPEEVFEAVKEFL